MPRGDAPVDLAFSVHGPADGTPLVLLHGFPLARQMWKAQMQALGEAGCRVVTPDLRGHGESPVPTLIATMERCARDVLKMADDLGFDRFALGGFSMGGYVALDLMAHAPERVDRLLLIDTRADADTPAGRAGRRDLAQAVRSQGSIAAAEAMMPKLLTERTRRENPELTEGVLRMILNTDPKGITSALEGMARRPDRTDLLARISVPTLVVVGEDDTVTPPDAARTMARTLPNAKLVTVPRAAHLTPLERPTLVNDAIVDWLRTRRVARAVA